MRAEEHKESAGSAERDWNFNQSDLDWRISELVAKMASRVRASQSDSIPKILFFSLWLFRGSGLSALSKSCFYSLFMESRSLLSLLESPY